MAVVINLNPDLKRLQDEGYELEIREGCAIIYNIPYLDSSLTIKKGILVSPLKANGETVKYDGNHTIFFQGAIPYHKNGTPIQSIFHSSKNTTYAGIPVNMMFSSKPLGGYKDYYEKFTGYIQILSAEAQAVDPIVTAATFRRIISCPESIFNYDDTNASRAEIMDVNDKLKGYRIGIIGLGGTGSYLLDFLAKSPVAEIHLFDGDIFCQHNAFRAPGAPPADIFATQPYKTDYFKEIYDHMHRGIVSHPYNIEEQNLNALDLLDFVFMSMDSGEAKRLIADYLQKNNTTFIDTGIDIVKVDSELVGMTRCTLCNNSNYQKATDYISFAEVENGVYQSNIQTSELNAFCALTAILQWKKTLIFYKDNNPYYNCIYTTNDGEFKCV